MTLTLLSQLSGVFLHNWVVVHINWVHSGVPNS